MSLEQFSVLLRGINGEEMLVQGNPELIGRFMRIFQTNENISWQQPEIIEGNRQTAVEVVHQPPAPLIDVTPRPSRPVPPANLIAFYRQLEPESQTDQILVITFYYQNFGELESLALEDYTQAYKLLKRIPVETPQNMKSSVRNVVDRTKYLRNADRGRYMLTLAGEERIKNIISARSSEV